jgi:L-fucose mutarotase/ribose pyranase (RbsD/FucU family)
MTLDNLQAEFPDVPLTGETAKYGTIILKKGVTPVAKE